jgi:hypothetical protein
LGVGDDLKADVADGERAAGDADADAAGKASGETTNRAVVATRTTAIPTAARGAAVRRPPRIRRRPMSGAVARRDSASATSRAK